MSATPTFGRYAEIPFDQMTAEQKDGYKFLVEGPRGRLPGPYKVWVHNPKLLGRGAARRALHAGAIVPDRARARNRCDRYHPQVAFGLSGGGAREARQGGRDSRAHRRGDGRRPAGLVLGPARADGLRARDDARRGPSGLAGVVRPRGQVARPREHHRYGCPDGLLHRGLADDERLRRPGRNARPGALRHAMALTITPMHKSLGAEIAGVDLSRPLDASTREALSRALAEHLALVFRGQTLTPAQYLDAASVFGPPMEQHYSQHNMPHFPLIGMIWHRNGQQPAEQWHTDHTNRERPPAATILYGVEIPSAGGGTSVANMRAAYRALPEAERQRLDSLKTVNSLDSGRTDTRAEDREKYGKPIEHPMVRTHPVHGSRAVYFHISKATHIEGMTAEASRAYMADLIERMIRPEVVYHHAWRKGDVLVIDDRATMHRAHGDYDRSQSRVLWRIIVEGDRPVLV